jgi:hypothetical protein
MCYYKLHLTLWSTSDIEMTNSIGAQTLNLLSKEEDANDLEMTDLALKFPAYFSNFFLLLCFWLYLVTYYTVYKETCFYFITFIDNIHSM